MRPNGAHTWTDRHDTTSTEPLFTCRGRYLESFWTSLIAYATPYLLMESIILGPFLAWSVLYVTKQKHSWFWPSLRFSYLHNATYNSAPYCAYCSSSCPKQATDAPKHTTCCLQKQRKMLLKAKYDLISLILMEIQAYPADMIVSLSRSKLARPSFILLQHMYNVSFNT